MSNHKLYTMTFAEAESILKGSAVKLGERQSINLLDLCEFYGCVVEVDLGLFNTCKEVSLSNCLALSLPVMRDEKEIVYGAIYLTPNANILNRKVKCEI